MLNRIVLLFLALFWMCMMYFLWRSEYVGQSQVASTVPVSLVWKKILTAPDTSSLDIIHEGVKVGYCRWASNLGVEPGKSKPLADDTPPGLVQSPVKSYRLDVEGNVAIASEMAGKMRFDCSLNLSTNNVWQSFHLDLKLKPSHWEVNAIASSQTVRFLQDDQDGRFERVMKFSELQNPQTLMEEFNLPPVLGVIGSISSLQGGKGAGDSLGLEWKAHSDWVSIGHTSVRAFMLEAVFLDRYRMKILVSRVGEILKVELPDDWQLVNEQLGAL